MKEISKPKAISDYISEVIREHKTVGFVPTMGALHKGHLDLVRRAKQENDIVICSIFVNPLQFNKTTDLEAYPNRIEKDKALLEEINCDLLFCPVKEELFATVPHIEGIPETITSVMEGVHRPGHFEGVAAVIARFYELFIPTKAYYGEKDFQQVALMKWLVGCLNINTEVVTCSTIREDSGLALSSRNLRLNEEEIKQGSLIFQALLFCKNNKETYTPAEMVEKAKQKLAPLFDVEYFVIADENTLQAINSWEDSAFPRAFVAANLSGVRLIDNLSLIP